MPAHVQECKAVGIHLIGHLTCNIAVKNSNQLHLDQEQTGLHPDSPVPHNNSGTIKLSNVTITSVLRYITHVLVFLAHWDGNIYLFTIFHC